MAPMKCPAQQQQHSVHAHPLHLLRSRHGCGGHHGWRAVRAHRPRPAASGVPPGAHLCDHCLGACMGMGGAVCSEGEGGGGSAFCVHTRGHSCTMAQQPGVFWLTCLTRMDPPSWVLLPTFVGGGAGAVRHTHCSPCPPPTHPPTLPRCTCRMWGTLLPLAPRSLLAPARASCSSTTWSSRPAS